MRILIGIMLVCLLPVVTKAQMYPGTRAGHVEPAIRTESLEKTAVAPANLLKAQGHYTPADWRRLVDSAWGPGMSTALKLQTFDSYWSKVDQTWGGFPNLVINWDSLKNVYRPIVESGVSRGRFYGILSRLTRELNEWHVYLKDNGIDAGLGLYSDNIAEYPNWPSFRYQAGVPILNLNAMVFRTPFGAGVTPLPDSSALVYSVMANHPLGLKPGDIVLGYDGVPWKRLIRDLFNAELPVLKGGQGFSASTASFEHLCIMIAGMNWGLFDTIDVAKYPGNDTVHYSTSLLKSIIAPYFIATEQLPVPGVSFPDLQSNKLVSWGVVEGTSIGYIYAWDWFGVPQGNTKVLFGQAVDDLMHVRNVQGLILDFRTNWGGWPDYANDGFKHLFNFDPTSNYGSAYRVPGGGHLDLTITTGWPSDYFTPTPEIFDHPIAVLTGPGAGSSGDYNAFRMRFHPMVRFFGKPTVGAYTDFKPGVNPEFTSNGYSGRVDNGCVYSKYNNEGHMIHKAFPVDEEVWLTRDGVAKGEDDVVKRALAWMSTLTYAHNVTMDHYYGRPGVDSVTVWAVLANPLQHQSAVSAVVTDYGLVHDSVLFYNDGVHGDGSSGDSIWGARLLAPATEGTYTVSVETKDIAQGTSRRLPDVALLTTAGPLAIDSVEYQDNRDAASCEVLPYVKNMGATAPFKHGTVSLICTDSCVTGITPSVRSFYDIAAGQTQNPTGSFWINYDPSRFPGHFNLKFQLGMDGHVCWTVPQTLIVTGVAEQPQPLPTVYALDQNYPNPFNPSTTITFELPKASHVTLSVYDILGREVSVLLNERRDAGVHEVKFDGSNLASGVYLYRLMAADFVQTRKLIVLK